MQYLPGDLAQLQVDDEANRRRQAQAQALQQAGFNPVQGGNQWLSMLASVMSTVKGGQMMSESDAKASEILAKKFEIENAQAQAQAEAERARRLEDRQWGREDAEFGAQTTAKYREPRNIDPLSPEGIAAALGLEKGKKALSPQGGGKQSLEEQMWGMLSPEQRQQAAQAKFQQTGSAPSGYRQTAQGTLEPIPGGPADPATKSASGLGAEAAAKVSLYENALRDAQEYQKAVVNPDGSFNDLAANLPKNVRLRESALRAKLRAESGASISPEEASAENARYGPKLMSSDETNVAAANRLIEDLQHQSTTIRGGSGVATAPAPQGQPTQTATNPQTGQRIGLINGQWVPL